MNCAGFFIRGDAMSEQQNINSLVLRGKLLKIFGWGFALLTLFLLGNAAYQTFKPDEILVVAGGVQPSFPIWLVIIGAATALFLVSILGVMICSLLWIHRAHSNLREQNIDISYSPGWAVGSYFVPFANLLVPFRAMRELYNRSHGEIPEHAHSTVEDVTAWWMSYIIGLSITTGLALKTAIVDLTNIVFLTPVWMEFTINAFGSITLVAAVFALIKLVTAITDAQSSMSYVGQAFE